MKPKDAPPLEPTELAQKVLAVALEQVIEAGVVGVNADEWAYCTVDPAWELVLQARVWGREQTVTDDFYTTVPRFAHQGREWPVCSSILSRGVVAARFYPDEDARSHSDQADTAFVRLPPAAALEVLAGVSESEIRSMLDAWTKVRGETDGADEVQLFEALCITLSAGGSN